MQNLLNQFEKLFEYDFWANHEVLSALKANENRTPRMLEIFSHILRAQLFWYQRITGDSSHLKGEWSGLSIEDYEEIILKNKRLLFDFLDSLSTDDLTKVINYKNSKGQAFESSIYEILMQLISHGSYHRGQIAILLRQANVQPPATDYIYYVRKK